jgi:GT2 family glycosyltransferase
MIYVLLPVHNRLTVTRKFLDLLNSYSQKQIQVIVIDDGSTDGTSEMLTKHPIVNIILNGDGNLWWAGSLNLGINYLNKVGASDHSPVLIINDDVTFESQYIENATKILEDNPDAMLLSGMWSQEKQKNEPSGMLFDVKNLSFSKPQEKNMANCGPTRGLFMTFGTIKKVGKFKNRQLPHYLTDYEYTYRAVSYGIKIIEDPNIYIKPVETNEIEHEVYKLFSRQFLSFQKIPSHPRNWIGLMLCVTPLRYFPRNIAIILKNLKLR